jgi:hypothetical protein
MTSALHVQTRLITIHNSSNASKVLGTMLENVCDEDVIARMLDDAEAVVQHIFANISVRKRPDEIFPLTKVVEQMMAKRMTPLASLRT